MNNNLDSVVQVWTAPGVCLGLYRVFSYCDAPTYGLEGISGGRINWRVDLCREATPEQVVEYWKGRAMAAEAKLGEQ